MSVVVEKPVKEKETKTTKTPAQEVVIAIDSGVPVPPQRVRRIYDFSSMKAGDSFRLPLSQAGAVRGSIASWKRSHEGEFVTRKLKERADPGDPQSTLIEVVRVWRVK